MRIIEGSKTYFLFVFVSQTKHCRQTQFCYSILQSIENQPFIKNKIIEHKKEK